MGHFKRYCKTLQLADDPELIQKYKQVHAQGAAWPEVTEGMKAVGILDMEIYLLPDGRQLFMIMDTVADFDHEQAMKKLATLDRQQEWENYVSEFQVSEKDASAENKWQLMERIYEMDQEEAFQPLDGQLKSIDKLQSFSVK
ncbi:L-rhamnose mutarotase [Persicobacter psychrovividus]